MQTARILQAVVLMLIVALAASCTATKEYTSKLFAPKTILVKDSQAISLRFLQAVDEDKNTADWVSTDLIMGRDTSGSTTMLDNLAKSIPAVNSPASEKQKNDAADNKESKDVIASKPADITDVPLARSGSMNGTRQKNPVIKTLFNNPHLFIKKIAMKRTFILSIAAVITAAIIFTSCQPSRVWANKKKQKENREFNEPETYRQPSPPPTRYYSNVALIITPSPGFVMKQHPSSGRFYHRSPSGYLYWKGYDNRFYIDQSYINRLSYSRWEYDEWKRYSRQSR